MARRERHRDDLFAEISTFSPRWELWLRSPQELVVAGCRSDGRWSLYRQNGDYLQFLNDGYLRRAYWEDAMLLSTGTGLARLSRRRTESETVLLRSELMPRELGEFLAASRNLLQVLSDALTSGAFEIRRSEPLKADPAATLQPLVQQAFNANPPWAPAVAR